MTSKKGYRQLGVETAARLGVWLMGNLEWVADHTAQEVADKARVDLKAEHLTPGMVYDLCKKLGVEVKSGRNASRGKGGIDRTHIVALAVRDLYDHMKLPVPPLLQAVCQRKQAKEN